MRVTTEHRLDADDVATLYPLYLAAFEPLLTEAAARHVLTSVEFAEEMADPRIDKIVVRDGDRLLALTTVTTDLTCVGWINPSYFAAVFPDATARGAMFYLGYTLVDPVRRRSNALMLMASEVNRRLAEAQGVIAYDICSFNDAHGVGRLTSKIFGRAREIRSLDTQTYYAADYRDTPVAVDAEHRLPERTVQTVTLLDRPDLLVGLRRLLDQLWPAGLRAAGSDLALGTLLERAAGRQVLLIDENDRVQAAALCLPARPGRSVDALAAGWDEAVRSSAEPAPPDEGSAHAGVTLALPLVPSTGFYAGATTVSVLRVLQEAARAEGASALVVALRPERKRRYPLFGLADYLGWRTDRGEPLDPEVRTHLALGGTLLATGEPETVANRQEWERRLGQPLPADGSYVVDGAAPLVLVGGTGRYRDAQVWVAHSTGPTPAADPSSPGSHPSQRAVT